MTAPQTAAIARAEQIYGDAVAVRQQRKDLRITPPLIRLWDGNWNLRGISRAEYSADFKWLLNESGTGRLELPADHYLAKWIMDASSRSTQNVHVTVDKDGARWSGRMKFATLKKTEAGLNTVVVQFMHDYEEVKWIQVWSNPFLPAAFQFPRVFMLAGPSRWCLKLALFLNILRKETNLWTFPDAAQWALPDDPLDPAQWFNLDQSRWSMVVAPNDFLSDTSVWTVLSSRWKTWHDMAEHTLEDAQLMVTTRRYLAGDPPPWPGARLRHGCLVFDIVDKSGFYTGTSEGGSVLTGLEHTVQKIINEGREQLPDPLQDPAYPEEYKRPDWIGTLPSSPWVVYREGEYTGIETSEFTIRPATAVQINCGGRSPYGVNEAISQVIQMVGNLTSTISIGTPIAQISLPPMGGVIDTILKPLYTDTVLAWMSFKSPLRAPAMGWSHYFEFFQQGADRAYTLSSLIAVRMGLWATRGYHGHKLTVADGSPYLIGENGQGHFFLGDRIGATVKGLPRGQIYVDQVTSLELSWKRGVTPAWKVTIGNDAALEDPVAKAMKYVQRIMSDLRDLGVMS
ncbi:phage tail protein [Nocardia sp. NPDC050175]|uniref:Gp37-like protein n=1 Tax=Nocardia sp. NPDC050175 TaxID=3364317 RepID=UPI0037AA58E0